MPGWIERLIVLYPAWFFLSLCNTVTRLLRVLLVQRRNLLHLFSCLRLGIARPLPFAAKRIEKTSFSHILSIILRFRFPNRRRELHHSADSYITVILLYGMALSAQREKSCVDRGYFAFSADSVFHQHFFARQHNPSGKRWSTVPYPGNSAFVRIRRL